VRGVLLGHTDWVFNELRNWDQKEFYDLYRYFASEYFLPGFRSVWADPRFMPFMQKIGRVDSGLSRGIGRTSARPKNSRTK
jgi:hypothetical protein